jgi:erythronate-4-phosphate dehydrogenase
MVYMSVRPNHARTDRRPGTDRVKIVVDQNIRGAGSTFGRHSKLEVVDGRKLRAEHLDDTDVLIIRTTTRVDQQLLQDSNVGFIGTTSIGTDHLEIDWLEQQGITWASAPGCNADSAAQYTLAMLWLACERLGCRLTDQRVGIIGRGNVGSRVQSLLALLGVETVANDPPLAELGEPGLTSLEEVLSQDIVSLHVPLERAGAHPTYRFIASEQLARMSDHSLLVNTARGDVIDGNALMAELGDGRLHAALDVWPGEPVFSSELLESTTVATPHVAGYSDDGKRNGTQIVYRAFCDWADLRPFEPAEPSTSRLELGIAAGEDAISKALDTTCFVRRHDAEMRALSSLKPGDRATEFDRLRREYPSRRDFHAWTIRCKDSEMAQVLGRLGFSVIPTE